MSEFPKFKPEVLIDSKNAQTVATYESRVQEYINSTSHEVNGDLKVWLDESVDNLPHAARILEIGSGFGRDADYLHDKGYSVECTDATLGFVELLQDNGFNARELNVLTDEITSRYDFVFADAVLLHFDREQTADVMQKVYGSLEDGGRFAFTVKQGIGEEWSTDKLDAPRYFCYWQKGQIEELLEYTGFHNHLVEEKGSGSGQRWLHVVAYKAPVTKNGIISR